MQGHHEPFPSGLAEEDDSNIHPKPSEAMTSSARETRSPSVSSSAAESDLPNGLPIPCHHIRLGDYIIVNGRPCQIIRISTNSATGQYLYQGVDLFTRQLHEQSSFISKPAPGISVQTMLGPIFRQYRALDMQDGLLVVTTDTGDVKQNFPVIDQSNFRARLGKALKSNPSSTRVLVLVLSDGSHELAVDMKVIHGPRPAGVQIEQTFRDAVRTNDISAVKDVLQKGVNINTLDDDGRIALFDAMENHSQDMVDLLLQHKIDLRVLDKNGKSVLDIAVSDPEHYLTTFTLLKKGASSTDKLDEGISQLLSAAAKGQDEEVKELLRGSVNHSSRDRLGYTALHEAACFGHYETAKMLIRDGADVNKLINHGGATVLHAVVQRGREHREFLLGARSLTPVLSENHVRVVALLLQHSVNTTHRRSHDNLTIQELISEELGLAENFHATERSCLQKILILLENSVSQQGTGRRVTWPTEPSESDQLKALKLQVQWHTPGRVCGAASSPVWNFIYSHEHRHNTRDTVRVHEGRARGGVNSSKPRDYWRWAHLPANNVWH